jgi:hypothetical protein
MKSKTENRWLRTRLRYGGGIVIGLITSSISTWTFNNPSRVLGFFSSFLSQFWLNLVGAVLIFPSGAGLYFVRQHWHFTYGCIEIGFALAIGWYAINKVQHVGYGESLSIIAAVYLVVRGLDNVILGREEKIDEAKADRTRRYRLNS